MSGKILDADDVDHHDKHDGDHNGEALVGMKREELEERKRYFFQTIKTKNWGKLAINLAVASVFIAYFVQLVVYHNYFKS